MPVKRSSTRMVHSFHGARSEAKRDLFEGLGWLEPFSRAFLMVDCVGMPGARRPNSWPDGDAPGALRLEGGPTGTT